jgi:DNA-directed RNA polymerase subunit RPC12/RpoP
MTSRADVKVCVVCGKSLELPRSNVDTCSEACLQAKEAKAAGKSIYECVRCGERFTAMTPQDARLATGRAVQHCGTTARWKGGA